MNRSDKYGISKLQIGESKFLPTDEVQTTSGFYRVYNRLYVQGIKRDMKLSIKKTEGGVNVQRMA